MLDQDRWDHSWLKMTTTRTKKGKEPRKEKSDDTRIDESDDVMIDTSRNEPGQGEPNNHKSSSGSPSSVSTAATSSKTRGGTSTKLRKPQEKAAPAASATNPAEIDRYSHDMEMAEAIRRSMRLRKEAKSITEQDVRLGLDSLDEADRLRLSGDFASSLRTSELAIELLLEFLKSSDSGTTAPAATIDRDFVAQRIQSALSDAAAVKHHLKTMGLSRGSSNVSASSSSVSTATSTKSQSKTKPKIQYSWWLQQNRSSSRRKLELTMADS